MSTISTDTLLEFRRLHVAVVGDFYLDEYVTCHPIGISPEMPVLRTTEGARTLAPGCAGNVAANLAALGAKVTCFGAVGQDAHGDAFLELLQAHGLDVSGMIRRDDSRTGVFTRIVLAGGDGSSQHLVRIDNEPATMTAAQRKSLSSTLLERQGEFDAIFVSDYDETGEDRGIAGPQLAHALRQGVTIDRPRLVGSSRLRPEMFNGFDMLFANREEAARLGAGSMTDLRQEHALDLLCTTAGAEGATVTDEAGSVVSPSLTRDLVDPCGAGDAFASAFLLSSLSGLANVPAAAVANTAAAIAVSRPGTVVVTQEDLMGELRFHGAGGGKLVLLDALVEHLESRRARKKIVFTNGYFDLFHSGHVHLLREARALGDMLVVGINSDRSARENKGEGRPVLDETERIQILASLEQVDFVVVFEELTPINVIRRVLPHVLVKGGNYAPEDVVGREVVEAAGGTVRVIPYQGDVSTTNLIRSIKKASDGTRGQ